MGKHTEFRAAMTAGEAPGSVSGQAVPYGVPIGQGLVEHYIAKGTFARLAKDPARVKILWAHDSRSPIGHVTGLEETDAGLQFTGRILDTPAVPDGQRALALLREGVIDEVSIGFEWGKWTEEYDEKRGVLVVRHTRARLTEISVVTAGAAGRDARITSAADDTPRTYARSGASVAQVLASLHITR